jgi:dipeptidyl aminopeptidase/acylaminoacyl peptidase
MAISPSKPGHILVRMNQRDPRFHDVFEVEIASGERRLVERNTEGYSSYIADQYLRLRFARLPRADGGAIVRRRDAMGGWVDWFAIEPGDANTTSLSHLDISGETLYLVDSRGRDTAALVALNTTTGESELLAADDSADIEHMIVDSESRRALAWASGELCRTYKPIDDTLAGDITFLDVSGIGMWSPVGLSYDLGYWLIVASADTAPATIWLYDRVGRRLEKLFDTRPELAGLPLARTHPVRVTARDGLTLVTYLTLPREADATPADDRPCSRSPLPLVVIVHGGPATRDRLGFDAEAQWLANRGYAVLKVNYRGSAGFGKAFQEGGNLQWGRAMSDDVDDGVDWAIAQGIADPERIAITGGSYGGYAVLTALTRTPTKYACGIDLVGPSNLETLIATVPVYWESMRKAWLRSVGDPGTPEGLQSLRDRSPLHRADSVRRPLMIGQGANDPRVKQSEAEQMVAALKENGVPVTYALFPDEGHGFGRPANAICFAALKEIFLARYLGGLAEPLHEQELQASSLELIERGQLPELAP